jgi:hypothetical protein
MNKDQQNDRDGIAGQEGKQRRARPAQASRPDDVSMASAESFPASDPPSWTGMRAGPPDRSDTAAAS